MKKLPFKTEPQQETQLVGDEKTGTLEIPVLGGLSVGEQIQLDEATRSHPSPFAEASRLAVKIDAELKLNDVLFAFDIVATPNWENEQQEELKEKSKDLPIAQVEELRSQFESRAQIFRSARIRFAPDILQLNSQSEQGGKARQMAVVTAILKNRVDPSWTLEDSKGLTHSLFQKLWEFAQSEMGEGEGADKPSEEEVGKLPVEKSEETPLNGTSSTGESSDTGPMIPDSVPMNSLVSQPG